MTLSTHKQIEGFLQELADPAIAEHSGRFFKSGKGQYGEGDQFLGIRVPVLRQQVKAYRGTSLPEIENLLASQFHEARLFALFLLVDAFARADATSKEEIYCLYLANTKNINNWDLVDSSAHQIVGTFLLSRDRSMLLELANSVSLWERRIAIVATYHFIRKHQFDDTLKLAEILLGDKEDLIHKAVGWMLREVGKRDEAVEKQFLQQHYKKMPRTMLRYAIEKFPADERKRYLEGMI